ncbi:MAG TPA: ATP-dependent DNA helicase RecQ [Planctomycetota bacterium]
MERLLEVVQKHWGFDALRPLQGEAMAAAVAGRDALVVLPTGGGKSLCYQAPALLSTRPTVVVSPLISLMKDQVDRLLSRGIPAAFYNSSLDAADRRRVSAGVAKGEFRLIFVAPERFGVGAFGTLLTQANIGAFAIDEAHCISHWGHDFRQEYRELGRLKREFPGVPVHAFTATATPRVREDIVNQLGLDHAEVLVGDFFRPNLNYRAVERGDATADVLREVKARPGQPGIVYCIRRADVDDIAETLQDSGVKAAPYHAGMDDDARTTTQDRFTAGEIDVVVATVAFGMGIDRADIRFVLHAAMPKSLEHYQQETGRAGRDGGPSDCVLFWGGQDYQLWRSIIEKNDAGDADEKIRMLGEMYGFCSRPRCRHRHLVEYFGQAWEREGCGACDVCTGTIASRGDSDDLARKLLQGVDGLGQRYGISYVAEVLAGEMTDRVEERGHGASEVFGLIKKPKGAIFGWLRQLMDQDLLKPDGEYGVLKLTRRGLDVVRGDETASLFGGPKDRQKPKRLPKVTAKTDLASDILQGDDKALFEKLRALRFKIAEEEGRPAFMVFSDKALRSMVRLKPRTPAAFLEVNGVGDAKLEAYGDTFLKVIRGAP